MIGLSLLLILCEFFLGWGLEILFPKEKSIFEEEFVSVVIKVDPKKIKELSLKANGSEIPLKLEERDTYCKTVKIKPGENLIEVRAVDGKGKVRVKTVRIFMVSQVFPEGNVPPKDFKVFRFHTSRNESLCAKCHKLNGEQETCKSCHPKLIERKFQHPPAVLGCTLCHTGGKDSKYAWAEPISETCYLCHGDRKETWLKKKYIHGPPSTGRCNICHNPHSSEHRFFLRKQILDLCTTCHSEKRVEKHPLSGFVFGSAHPISGKPDPARPGRELTCTGCHNPHASNYRFFFQNDYSGEAILCLRCHKK